MATFKAAGLSKSTPVDNKRHSHKDRNENANESPHHTTETKMSDVTQATPVVGMQNTQQQPQPHRPMQRINNNISDYFCPRTTQTQPPEPAPIPVAHTPIVLATQPEPMYTRCMPPQSLIPIQVLIDTKTRLPTIPRFSAPPLTPPLPQASSPSPSMSPTITHPNDGQNNDNTDEVPNPRNPPLAVPIVTVQQRLQDAQKTFGWQCSKHPKHALLLLVAIDPSPYQLKTCAPMKHGAISLMKTNQTISLGFMV
jgi:hypothetical protein